MRFIAQHLPQGPRRCRSCTGSAARRSWRSSTLDHLDGYGGARPVRIGNGAYDQRQNDVWGALLDSIYLHEKALRGSGTPADREIVREQVEAAIEAWPKPDQGIWESRGEPKHYVSSKLMIWVAVDRGVAARPLGAASTTSPSEWRRSADEFRAELLERGCPRRGLPPALRDRRARRLDPADPAASASCHPTTSACGHGRGDRRRTDRERAGPPLQGRGDRRRPRGEEGTFLICSFWLVSALSEIGEPLRARELCERLLEAAGWLDLYAEELDAPTGRHLGNFPQAFTHLALINAVSHVIADEQREDGGVTAVFSEMGGVREDA